MVKISQKDALEMVELLKRIKTSWNKGEMGLRHEKDVNRILEKVTRKPAGRE